MTEFNFPDVGEGITEGKLVKWLVREGEQIKTDQSLAEVETDKAVVEIPSPYDGVAEKLLHNEGDTIKVGKPLLIISEKGSEPAPAPEEHHEKMKEEPQQEQPAPEPQQPASPTAVHSSEILALPSVRKLAQEKNIDLSSVHGTGPDGRITEEDVMGTTAVQAPAQQAEQPAAQPAQQAMQSAELKPASRDILATLSTKKLARELGVDINNVHGTGEHGKITDEDIRKAAEGKTAEAPAEQPESKVTTEHLHAKPAEKELGQEERVPLSNIRLAIAKKMVESKHTAPHVTHSDEADITELVAVRTKEKDVLKERGIRLTFLSFFMKAAALALQKHPLLNARMNSEANELILKKYYHIAVAIDAPEGLFVPVIRDVDKKSIVELSQEITDLSQKAHEMKLSIDEMQGGTFTITSIGSIGGTVFTPIINYPQVAILGIGKIQDKPVAKDGKIVIRKICTFSLSFDHRVLYGAEAARFMNTFIEYIEDPTLLFMEMN